MNKENKTISMGTVISLISSNDLSNESKKLLGESTFYFCCGSDPTPIIAFSDVCPLFIYVDNMLYTSGFESTKNHLYDDLHQHGYKMLKSELVKSSFKISELQNCEISIWSSKCGSTFGLVYIEDDAEKGFRHFYSAKDKNGYENYIMPKCICNINYECDCEWLFSISKRTEYILGHCYDEKHEIVDEFPYYGAHGTPDTRVHLYKRFWYYVF